VAGPVPLPDWVPQALQQQLTGRLVAVATSGAIQRLTVHLHPADLGAVQVVATMDDGVVSLQLAAGNHLTRDALRAALPTLQADLTAAGLGDTRLDVSDQSPGGQFTGTGTASGHAGGGASGREAGAMSPSPRPTTAASVTTEPIRPALTADGRRAIDVRI
jgi:flagellar hook-length control protein FliK